MNCHNRIYTIISGAFLLICLLILSALFIVQAFDKKEFDDEMNKQYVSTTVVIVNTTYTTQYKCSVENCQCAETTVSNNCSYNLQNHIQEECSNGEFCCLSTYDECIDPDCIGYSQKCRCTELHAYVGDTLDNAPQYRTYYDCYGKRCSRCERTIYQCNHRCIQQLYNQKCEVQCGDIYTVHYDYVHFPSNLPTTCNSIECYKALYDDPTYIYKGNRSNICTQYNSSCSDPLGLVVGGKLTRYINMDEPNVLSNYPLTPSYKQVYNPLLWLIIIFPLILCTISYSIEAGGCLTEEERARRKIQIELANRQYDAEVAANQEEARRRSRNITTSVANNVGFLPTFRGTGRI